MSCPHDEIGIVLYESRWGHSTMPEVGFQKLIYPTLLEHIGTCALSGSLASAEGNAEEGRYVVDDGEAKLHYLWHTETGRECETHSEGCICECCDPVDRNHIGGVE
ncbi:hypothetical protein SEA_BANTAM_139 [Gordonia phage Bantam]|uniref:Uncharacterized protein n=1 Tax=Gordonia phage Bantam TaxID=1887641 RepID=A0A1B3AYI3_9CAUD|nr:hypothetical protein BIZ77_gp040 [Gordonia phage Bantam]AOE43828.1 hypothetical protein SEA_BANTAM_139 [Gordonia phage Bantam]